MDNSNYSKMGSLFELCEKYTTLDTDQSLNAERLVHAVKIFALASSRFSQNTQAVIESARVLASLTPHILESSISTASSDECISVSPEDIQFISELEPLVPVEEKAQFEKIITQPPKEKKKLFTKTDIQWLIMLVITIISLVPKPSETPTEYELATMQYQEEALDKLQHLIELIETDDSQVVEIDNHSDGFDTFLQETKDLTTPKKTIDNQDQTPY